MLLLLLLLLLLLRTIVVAVLLPPAAVRVAVDVSERVNWLSAAVVFFRFAVFGVCGDQWAAR